MLIKVLFVIIGLIMTGLVIGLKRHHLFWLYVSKAMIIIPFAVLSLLAVVHPELITYSGPLI